MTDDQEQGCTELVAATKTPPLLLLDAWRDYLHEHCKKKGQDPRRVAYTAKPWLRIMGPDAEPGKWKLSDIARYDDVRAAEGIMPSSRRREMCLQQAALNHAHRRDRLDRVVYFDKPSGENRKRRPMTIEEYQRLMKSPLKRRVRMFYIVAFHTGHRAGAIEGLTWDRVNLEAGTIDFNEPGARRTNKRRVDGFPMPQELLRRLISAKAYRDLKTPDDPYVIGAAANGTKSTTYHSCKAALKAVGIDELGLCRHTVRKTFVTERIKAGKNPEKVAALIADNVQTMRRHYSVLLTNDLRETAEL